MNEKIVDEMERLRKENEEMKEYMDGGYTVHCNGL